MTKAELDRIFRCNLFFNTDHGSAKRIFELHGASVVSFLSGDVILSPNTSEKKLGILLSGKAEISTPDPAKETLLRFLCECEPFGIANLFSDAPFISIIHAKSECKVFFMSEAAVDALLEADRGFLHGYLGFLSGRIRFLNRKIGYLTAGSAERRLALYLLSFESEEIILENSLSSLSDLLGLGRASLYRAFDKLCEDGCIKKDGRIIHLVNPGALGAYR